MDVVDGPHFCEVHSLCKDCYYFYYYYYISFILCCALQLKDYMYTLFQYTRKGPSIFNFGFIGFFLMGLIGF